VTFTTLMFYFAYSCFNTLTSFFKRGCFLVTFTTRNVVVLSVYFLPSKYTFGCHFHDFVYRKPGVTYLLIILFTIYLECSCIRCATQRLQRSNVLELQVHNVKMIKLYFLWRVCESD